MPFAAATMAVVGSMIPGEGMMRKKRFGEDYQAYRGLPRRTSFREPNDDKSEPARSPILRGPAKIIRDP